MNTSAIKTYVLSRLTGRETKWSSLRLPFRLKSHCSLRLFNDSVSGPNAGILGLIRLCPHYLSLKLTWDLPHRLTSGPHQAPVLPPN